MKHSVLLSLLLALGCMHVHGAPVDQDGMQQGSCEDAQAKGAAGQALNKINQDRQEGYVLGLHRLSNVHITKHVSHDTERRCNVHLIFLLQYCFPVESDKNVELRI